MRDWFSEVLVVFCHSTRTQIAIALGLIIFAGTLLMGHGLVGGIDLRGPMAPVADVIRDALMHRYEKAAWMALGAWAVVICRSHTDGGLGARRWIFTRSPTSRGVGAARSAARAPLRVAVRVGLSHL